MDYKVVLGNKTEEEYKKILNNIKFTESIVHKVDGNEFNFDWIDFVVAICPYIDKIFNNPKSFLVSEEEILNIEKTKKVTTESVRFLVKHANFVDDFNEDTGYVRPSKMLNVYKEDTLNTYENRFICSLVVRLETLIIILEEKLKNLDYKINNSFVYNADTNNKNEEIKCELKIISNKEFNMKEVQDILDKIDNIKKNIRNWHHSELYMTLEKERAISVNFVLKRTNVILKNPNFQQAAKLWDFISSFNLEEENNNKVPEHTNKLPSLYQKYVNNNFIINYYILKIMTCDNEFLKSEYEKQLRRINGDLLENLIEYMMEKNKELTKEELVTIVSDKYDQLKIKQKNDGSEVENKIKSELKNFLEGVDGSYFVLGDGLDGKNSI